MPVTIRPPNDHDPHIEVTLTGTLHKNDYQTFVPLLEKEMKQSGDRLLLLVDMVDFHGWDAGGLWEDLKFDIKHFKDFERVAMVGNKKWEKGMAMICKPFTTAKIAYFDQSDRHKAVEWLMQGQTQTANV